MQPIIYPRAGKIILRKYATSGALSNNFIVGNGTVESIAANVNIATTELADGNSDFPMGVYDTGKSGQLVVTMSSFQPELYAALMGTVIKEMTDTELWAADQEISVPEDTPYTVKLSHTPKDDGTFVLVNRDASPFVKVDSDPAQGQYSVSGDIVEFNSADAGIGVFLTYEWIANKASLMSLPAIGVRPVVQAIVSMEATDDEEINVYDANIIVDKCKATGDINQPTQQRAPQNWSFTMQVLKPRGGYNPIYWKYAQRV